MLLSMAGFAQNQQLIDSLHHQLATAKDDRSRIHAQIELCSIIDWEILIRLFIMGKWL